MESSLQRCPVHDSLRCQTRAQGAQFRSKVIPPCCTHSLEQAARQDSPSERHCFFSAVAEITFVFNFVTPSSPSNPHPSPLRLPPLIDFPPPPPPRFPSSLQKAMTMWFSRMESDGALRVDIEMNTEGETVGLLLRPGKNGRLRPGERASDSVSMAKEIRTQMEKKAVGLRPPPPPFSASQS